MLEYRHRGLAEVRQWEEIPLEERLWADNTYDFIRHTASGNPALPAVSFITGGKTWQKPVTYSYQDLLGNINRTANLFHDLGVGPGDVVSYLLPNLPQTHFVIWGGQAAGVVNPINPNLPVETILGIMREVKSKVLVALGEATGPETWRKALAVRERLPWVRALVRVEGQGEKAGAAVLDLEESLPEKRAEGLVSGREFDPGSLAAIYHTGGITGAPRMVPLLHRNMVAMAYMAGLTLGVKKGEAILTGLPLHHVRPTILGGLTPLSLGAHAVILTPQGFRDRLVLENFYRIVERYRAVAFSAPPPVLASLLEVPRKDEDISSLRRVWCGFASLGRGLALSFESKTGIKILENYGLTETCGISSMAPAHGARKVGSVGVRLPYQEMKVFHLDEEGMLGGEARPGEVGDVCLRGPNLFGGYLAPEQNRDTWPGEGWFRTGDLGKMDSDGHLWLTGRRNEVIVREGVRIDPATIETPLKLIDGVAQAAAVGMPHPEHGHVPVAYVTLNDGSGLTPDEILDQVAQGITRAQALPSDVIILPILPQTPDGRVFKPALYWDAVRRVYQKELMQITGMVSYLEVRVREDRTKATLAYIKVKPLKGIGLRQVEKEVARILALYPVRYQLVMI